MELHLDFFCRVLEDVFIWSRRMAEEGRKEGRKETWEEGRKQPLSSEGWGKNILERRLVSSQSSSYTQPSVFVVVPLQTSRGIVTRNSASLSTRFSKVLSARSACASSISCNTSGLGFKLSPGVFLLACSVAVPLWSPGVFFPACCVAVRLCGCMACSVAAPLRGAGITETRGE